MGNVNSEDEFSERGRTHGPSSRTRGEGGSHFHRSGARSVPLLPIFLRAGPKNCIFVDGGPDWERISPSTSSAATTAPAAGFTTWSGIPTARAAVPPLPRRYVAAVVKDYLAALVDRAGLCPLAGRDGRRTAPTPTVAYRSALSDETPVAAGIGAPQVRNER